MKYTDVGAFQKHLKGSAPSDFAMCYTVAMTDAFEREKVLERMKRFFLHYRPNMAIERVKIQGADVKDLLLAMEEVSLFNPEKLIIVYSAESLNKEAWKKVDEALKRAADGVSLFFSMEKGITADKRCLEKHGVVLDLTAEKPWDKKKRVQASLLEKVQKEGARISPSAMESLFAKAGVESASLDSELHKLLCYIGDRKEITEKDIAQVTTASLQHKGFAVASALVWQEKMHILDEANIDDLTALLSMLGAIRYHVYIGLKICENIAANQKIEVENIRPKQLEFYAKKSAILGFGYFENALIELYEIEKEAKSSSLSVKALWDLLRIRIHGAISTT